MYDQCEAINPRVDVTMDRCLREVGHPGNHWGEYDTWTQAEDGQ